MKKLDGFVSFIQANHRGGADSFGAALAGSVIGAAFGGGAAILVGALLGYLTPVGLYHLFNNKKEERKCRTKK